MAFTVVRRKCCSLLKRIRVFIKACSVYFYNSFLTNVPGYFLRTFYLRHVLGLRIGENVAIHMGCFFTGDQIDIGDRSVVNRNCYLDGRGGLKILEDVSISPEVYLLSMSHNADSPGFDAVPNPLTIERHVWIGARAILLPGATIREGSVIGAGSVVTKSTEPFAMVAGNPAKFIRERSHALDYELRYFPYFNTDIGL